MLKKDCWFGNGKFNFSEQQGGIMKKSRAEYTNGVFLLIFYFKTDLSICEEETQENLKECARSFFKPEKQLLLVENSIKNEGKYIVKVEYHARCEKPEVQTMLKFVRECPEYFALEESH